MLTTQIGLIDQTGIVEISELAAAAAAYSIQVSRDLSQFWPVNAVVQVLSANDSVPPGVTPVFLVANLQPGEGGVHYAGNNQPYANVEVGDGWTIAASHEICELLVDPSTNRTHASTAIQVVDGSVKDTDGTFEYLVEVCDPVESADCGYTINGIAVSDFYTPHFFDPAVRPQTQYSFTGAITAPRQVLKGGYLSWRVPTTGVWQKLDFVNFDVPTIGDVEGMSGARSYREQMDRTMHTTRALSSTPRNHRLLRAAQAHRSALQEAGRARFHLFSARPN